MRAQRDYRTGVVMVLEGTSKTKDADLLNVAADRLLEMAITSS